MLSKLLNYDERLLRHICSSESFTIRPGTCIHKVNWVNIMHNLGGVKKSCQLYAFVSSSHWLGSFKYYIKCNCANIINVSRFYLIRGQIHFHNVIKYFDKTNK